DLNDYGATVFAETVRAVRAMNPETSIEVLPSDMMGDFSALQTLIDAGPDIMNHNLETARRLTPRVRAKATYDRTLEFLKRSKELNPDIPTKSSIMVGLGETKEELIEAMDDLRAHNVDILTLGQYLQPTKKHLEVERYY
ncbi:radical SAM protein, partial [Enterococcus faecium]|uniref:radical SAM protein n=1 Tax=Enterococcus faecium TaxID=1352 RepID=UPI00396D2D30